MNYVGLIWRPPSEARSLLLQVTLGCSHNRCSYCGMYRDKRFALKPLDVILRDIEEAAAEQPRRIFLMDGDALMAPMRHLEPILEALRERVPSVTRVGLYGDCRSILRKDPKELARLRELGLGIVYHGVESGDDVTLARIDKGSTRADVVTAAARLRDAGIRHSVIMLLGLGGAERSDQHARASAALLSEIRPDFVGVLTLMVEPGLPIFDTQARGGFKLPAKLQLMRELRTLYAESDVRCAMHANHANNYLPLQARLPNDRERVVALLDQVIAQGDESLFRPEELRGA